MLTGSTGSGGNTVWPKVTDANGVVLQGATVTAKEGVTVINNTTDANGIGQSMGLATATWKWTITKDGYSFTPASRAVPGDANFYMTQVAVPASTDPNTCAVYFTVYTNAGSKVAGEVFTFTMTDGPKTAGIVWLGGQGPLSATSDANGLVQISLPRTSIFDVAGLGKTWAVTVPNAATYAMPRQVGK